MTRAQKTAVLFFALGGLLEVSAQGSYGTRFAKGLAGVLNPTAFNGTGLAFTGCDPTHGCELFNYDMYNEPYLVAVRETGRCCAE